MPCVGVIEVGALSYRGAAQTGDGGAAKRNGAAKSLVAADRLGGVQRGVGAGATDGHDAGGGPARTTGAHAIEQLGTLL